jgi:DNA repair exonuclease SbcCD nuclease subunit
MKLCVLGDTHFGARGDSLEFHKYFQKFYDEVFFPYLIENDINCVVQLGDLFDRRKFINFNTLHLCRQYFFDRCQTLGIKVHTLLGNHDIAFKNTLEVNSTGLLLNEYENLEYYDDFDTLEFDGVSIDIVPWICPDNENEIFEKIKNSKSQICFGHFEIDGFEMDRGNVHQGGLDRKALSKYDVVLSGHFHHKSSSDNITYVGTPYEMTWADYNDPKGFHIFDTETRSLEFVENKNRMFYKLNYKDGLEHFSENYKSFDYSIYEGCYVKVIVIEKMNPFLFDIVIDKIYKAGACDVSIVEDFTEVIADDDKDIVDQAEDTMTILSKYIDNLQLQVESDKLKNLMRELYVESLTLEKVE